MKSFLSAKIYPSCPHRTNSVLCVFTLDLAGRVSSHTGAWGLRAVRESAVEKQLSCRKAHRELKGTGLSLFSLGASFSM